MGFLQSITLCTNAQWLIELNSVCDCCNFQSPVAKFRTTSLEILCDINRELKGIRYLWGVLQLGMQCISGSHFTFAVCKKPGVWWGIQGHLFSLSYPKY